MTDVTALVRSPGSRLAEGLLTHLERQAIDVGLAMRQWQHYVNTLLRIGWDVIEVPGQDDCPDAVFIEDTAVLRGHVALIARPGAASRRDEIEGTRRVLNDLGYTVVDTPEPATLDGGDVLKIGDTIYVGQSTRTNAGGVEALRAAFGSQGVEVVPVPVDKVLHLKSGVTALPDGTAVAYEPLFDVSAPFDKFLAVPEEPGAHVVVIDEGRVLMADSAPKTADMYVARGLEVITVGISEFEKLEGCVTCLSIRLRDLPANS
jgi:dimethylargininase